MKQYLTLLLLVTMPLLNAQHEHVNFDKMNQEFFTCIYRINAWGNDESKSGPGSTLEQTNKIRKELPSILNALNIETLLDLPCGDYRWMHYMDQPVKKYFGADIVPELIESNQKRYGDDKHTFMHLDVCTSTLPRADALLCRDCLTHLTFDDIFKAIKNIKKSGIKFIMISHYTQQKRNIDIDREALWNVLRYRPINFCNAPFNFPKPLIMINEGNTEKVINIADKHLAVWRVDDLPDFATE